MLKEHGLATGWNPVHCEDVAVLSGDVVLLEWETVFSDDLANCMVSIVKFLRWTN